jgi:hypothetical protein
MYVDYVEGTGVLASDGRYFAGDGGAGLFGSGGTGGDVLGNKVETGRTFRGGDGGSGAQGGSAGSVVGGGGLIGPDNYSGVVSVSGGNGGFGIGNAGKGGSVTQFANLFPPLTAGQGGWLSYTGGQGGESLAGMGGAGGSILGASPNPATNKLVGVIELLAGQGGSGLSGGAGGSIVNFRNAAGLTDPLPIFSAIAGHGGDGVTGAGGAGGSIQNFSASANGVAVNLLVETGVLLTGRFNRILAGNGGSSFGADGGAGGRLDIVSGAANNSSIVAVAGRGGDGLRAGGAGGSLLRTSLDSPQKVVAIAGDGGDAFGALSTAPNVRLASNESALITNLRAFGGFNGIGGNGGSINDFRQFSASVNVATDLIAGQGGDLINYGSAAPGATTTVGTGGSLSKVILASQAGRGNAGVPIVGYNPIPVGPAQFEFVDFVRTTNGWAYSVGDSVTPAAIGVVGQMGGNVGVIVGAAGTVRGDSFAADGLSKAGSVTGFQARSIMSMVAGSVDNIASIRAISSVQVTAPNGVYGAFKDFAGATKPHNLNTPLYLDAAGLQTNQLVLGGALIDGAVVAQNITPTSLANLPRVWQI